MILLPGSPVRTQAQSADGMMISPQEPILLPAFTTVGFSVVYEGDEDRDGAARVEYRKVGEVTWREGHPGLRIWHATDFSSSASGSQDEWASRLFHLEPGTTYEVQITFTDPDGVSGQNPKVFMVTTRSEPVLENSGPVYHVSPNGDDKNDGSAISPLRTIQKAVEMVNPGETVLIHGGIYRDTGRSEFLRIDKSGTAETPIIVRAAPGEEVIIDGADPNLAMPGGVTRQASDSGLYWAPLADDPDYVYYEEHFLMPFDSLNNLKTGLYGGDTRTGLYGGWWYDGSANRLYVKIPTTYDQWSGPTIDPTDTHIYAVLTNYGIRIRGDHVVIEGLILQHLGTALRLDGADYAVVRENVMRRNGTGIFSSTSASAPESSWSDFALIEGNDISCSPTFFYREWELGHDVIGTSGLSLSSGGNHVIRRNKVHDVENGIFAGSPWGGASVMGNVRYNAGTVMIENELYRIGDDSFELDGPVYNQVIYGNNMHDVFVGISAAPLSVGPLWMIRNMIYLTNRYFPDGSLDLTGKYMFPYGGWKYNTGGRGGGTGPSLIYHNTSVVMLDPASPLKSIAAFSTVWSNTPGFVVKTRNNSWVVNPGNKILWVGKDDIEGGGHPVEIDMDYDNLWVDLSQSGAYYLGVSPGDKTYSLQEVQNDYGLEIHGMSVLPAYGDPSQSDFSIPEDSPLVDAGVCIPGINDDYAGAAPDIGAYEHGKGFTPFGDVNGDGRVNEADIQACAGHILGLQDWGEAADVNGDGKADVLDIQRIVNILSRK